MPELDDAALDAIEARANAATNAACGVCMGHSPSRDGHDKGCAVAFLEACRTDVPALVAALRAEREEVARLRGIPEPDNHHNAYACPHCEAPIRAVEAERDAAIARAEAAEAAIAAAREACAQVEEMAGRVGLTPSIWTADLRRALDTGATT